MTTQRIRVVKNRDSSIDAHGLVKNTAHQKVGRAKNKTGPSPEDAWIDIQLEDHWLITDEEHKRNKKLQQKVWDLSSEIERLNLKIETQYERTNTTDGESAG